jgi:hypothetical protein
MKDLVTVLQVTSKNSANIQIGGRFYPISPVGILNMQDLIIELQNMPFKERKLVLSIRRKEAPLPLKVTRDYRLEMEILQERIAK